MDNTDIWIAIGWQAPYNFNHHKNKLAIGIYQGNVHGFSLDKGNTDQIKKMYSEVFKDGHKKDNRRCMKTYYQTMSPCNILFDIIQMDGIMGTSHHPMVQINIRPRNPKNAFNYKENTQEQAIVQLLTDIIHKQNTDANNEELEKTMKPAALKYVEKLDIPEVDANKSGNNFIASILVSCACCILINCMFLFFWKKQNVTVNNNYYSALKCSNDGDLSECE